MKTIFITSFHQLISRNILSSPFFEMLSSRKDIRIVLFCPKKKEVIFRENFGKDNVIIEGVDIKLTWGEKFLRYLSLSALSTESLKIKRRTELHGSGRILSLFLSNHLGRLLVRFLSGILVPKNFFKRYFLEYQPNLVFSADIQNDGDSRIVATAKMLGVRTLGMVRSWDNLTAKGLIKIKPEFLMVHNLLLKDEAIALNDFQDREISVVGVPHYDRYFDYTAKDKKSFCEELGLNPDKKIILYIPTGDRYLGKNDTDFDILSALEENFSEKFNLLVRMPPGDTVKSFSEKNRGSSVIFDNPGKKIGNIKNTELLGDDDVRLRDTIKNSDVIICGPSTMSLDATIMDKPVILINFDGKSKYGFYESISRFYSHDHFVPVMCSGAVYVSTSMDELNNLINRAISHPDEKKWERHRLSLLESGYFDGKNSARMLSIVERFLKSPDKNDLR